MCEGSSYIISERVISSCIFKMIWPGTCIARKTAGNDRTIKDPQSLEERAWEPVPLWCLTHQDKGDSEN